MKDSYINTLDRIHPDLIATFLSTGRCDAIPEDVRLFLKQLQWAAEIWEYERNIYRAATKLRLRILAEQHISLEPRTCQARIYAAISYFQIDNNISQKVWESVYADRFEDMAKMAVAVNDYKTAKACTESALECRRRASDINDLDRPWAPVFLFSPTLTVEEAGFRRKKLKDIARKSNDGYYLNLIGSLPLDKEDKERLLADAGIVEPQYEEVSDE